MLLSLKSFITPFGTKFFLFAKDYLYTFLTKVFFALLLLHVASDEIVDCIMKSVADMTMRGMLVKHANGNWQWFTGNWQSLQRSFAKVNHIAFR